MAENIDVKKFVPEKDTPIAGEDVFFDEKNNIVKVKNAYGTSIYDPSGKLLYGKGALYDTSIGSVSGRSVQIFGRGQEISGIEQVDAPARAERLAKESAYARGGTAGLVEYLNTQGTKSSKSAAEIQKEQATNQQRIAQTIKQQDYVALNSALERAQKSPLTNFMQRPAGRVTDDKIYFYNWVGGKENGEWFLYEAERTEENMDKYSGYISEQVYLKPKSLREELVPVTDTFGEKSKTAFSRSKIVPAFDTSITPNITVTGQVER